MRSQGVPGAIDRFGNGHAFGEPPGFVVFERGELVVAD
jgi:hypothetical protein